MSASEGRATFFRQSGWMTLAALLSGAFNMASTFVAQRMPEGQFNIFDTALSALGILTIPALGMQAAFAAQAAGAESDDRLGELAGTMRRALALLGLIWLALAGWWLLRTQAIMTAYKLTESAMLWVLLLIVLVNLLSPVPTGVIQGRQDFLWFGWANLLNGAGRFTVLWVVVHHLKLGALGALSGVLAGCLAVLGIVTWRAWPNLTFRHQVSATDWMLWFRRLLPVTLGLGALNFITQFDQLAQRGNLLLSADDADGFSAVRKIALALVFVVGALTSVMYPKIARSFQQSQPSEVLKLTLILTCLIAIGGATVATLFPELPLKLLSPARLWFAQKWVPPYCWALVPLALSNVLIWNLMARECYRSIPWLVGIALISWFTLQNLGSSVIRIITIIGISNTVLCLICGFFAWRDLRQTAVSRR